MIAQVLPPGSPACGSPAHGDPETCDTIAPNLSISQVARLLGCSRGFVYSEAVSGKIRHVRLGKHYRFRREWVEAYLASVEVIPAGYAPATIPEAV